MQTETDQSQTLLENPPGTADSHGQLELTIVSPNGLARRAFYYVGSEMIIEDDLSFEEWTIGLGYFKRAQTKLKLDFAAYVKSGEVKFGKIKVEHALGQLEFSLPDVNTAVSINSVPEEMRHPLLNAEHYIVLAKSNVPKKKLIQWAKTAAEQGLTPVQLKNSIEAGEVVTESMARKNTHGILNIHGVAAEFNVWLARVNGMEGIKKMKPDEIQEIVTLLKPMADLYFQLT